MKKCKVNFTFLVTWCIKKDLWGWKVTGAGMGGDGSRCAWEEVEMDLKCVGTELKSNPHADL